jgi:hypothetical protein
MSAIDENLTDAVQRFRRAAAEITDNFEARRPAFTDQVTPSQLSEALEQFLATGLSLDQHEGDPLTSNDVSQLGDYGLTLLADLATWATQLGLTDVQQQLETVAVAVAAWIMRHEGELRTLEPVVNALANHANRLREPEELEALADFMGRVISATSDFIKQDLERANRGRPWRVLQLNRAIVATRTYNPVLMDRVFNELGRCLPNDAPQFFAEGMQQMEALNYPPQVREIMSRYFDRWSRPTMH